MSSDYLITTDKQITGLISIQDNQCLIIGSEGSLQCVEIEGGQSVGMYQVPDVEFLYDGIRIDDDQLLLVDRNKGEVFTYDLTNGQKHTVVGKLERPTSVDKAVTDEGVIYIVNEQGSHKVRVYSENWKMLRSIGAEGEGIDGCLNLPLSSKFLADNTIIVSDRLNDRISRFTLQGDFISHLINQSHGITMPRRLAVQYPNIWVLW